MVLETETLSGLPAIVTTDLRLNEPRYASLPNIMKAKSEAARDRRLPADYGVDVAPRLTTLKVESSRRSVRPASRSPRCR